MENKTDIGLHDHVRAEGGFEDGLTGRVVDIDLSGEVKPWPRFTIVTDGATPEQRKRMGGFHAGNLTKLGPAEWVEDTGFWDDGAKSWVATMLTPDTHHPLDQTPAAEPVLCEIRIRDESTSSKVTSDSFSWKVLRMQDRSLVDQGIAPELDSARGHAVRAVIWHGPRKDA